MNQVPTSFPMTVATIVCAGCGLRTSKIWHRLGKLYCPKCAKG